MDKDRRRQWLGDSEGRAWLSAALLNDPQEPGRIDE